MLTTCRAGVKRKRDEEVRRNDSLPRSGPADVFCIYEPLDSGVSDEAQQMDTEDDTDGPAEGEINMLESITVAEESEAPGDADVSLTRRADLLFVKEAKAPHKLTPTVIRQAIESGDVTLRPADIMKCEDAASESARPTDVTQSRYWFAAVCSQLYSSMIEAGLRYGMITTGAYYVFVSIDPERPSIFRYSVCKQTPADIYTSALMRIVAFALLAMCKSKLPMTTEYNEIYRRAGLNWVTDIQNPSFSTEDAPGETPQDTPGMESYKDEESVSPDRQPHQADSANLPADIPFSLEVQHEIQAKYPSPPPQVLGKRQSRAPPKVVSQDAFKRQRTSVDASEATQPTTPTLSPRPPAVSPPVRSVPLRKRAYCSSACLQAVQHGSVEPTRCPNQADHDRAGRLTMVQLRQKLHAQLTGPLDGTGEWDYQFLHFSPGETQTVKLWLKSHGYTFIAKAFQAEDLSKMRGEARIYDRLQHLQGGCVPVCLGTIELPVEKSLIGFGQFVGLLLLAWAGWGMDEWPRLGIRGVGNGGEVDRRFTCALTKEVQNVLIKIHGAGVLHRDVALRNVMLQEITRRGTASRAEFTLRVQMIDFELSRTRAMYRRSAKKRLAHEGRQDMTAITLGHAEFTKACAKEMEMCTSAIAQWCE